MKKQKNSTQHLSLQPTATLRLGALVTFCMLLLLAFQVFWLQKEYNEQKNILQKEADILFRNTLQALEDSVLQKKFVVPVPTLSKEKTSKSDIPLKQHPKKQIIKEAEKPSVSFKDTIIAANIAAKSDKKNRVTFQGDETFIFKETARYVQALKIDSTTSHSKDKFFNLLEKLKPEGVQKVKTDVVGNMNITTLTMTDTSPTGKKDLFFVKSFLPPDSLRQLFGKVARVVMLRHPNKDSIRWNGKAEEIKLSVTINQKNGKSNQDKIKEAAPFTNQLVINISEKDSLKTSDIADLYKQKLQKANIDLMFDVIRRKKSSQSATTSEGMSTSSFSSTMPIGSSYNAVFPHYQVYLFKKIIPQGLFSLFLLVVTGLAFGVVYQHLQRQRRLTELKNDFISNVTHELKTPIATVSVAIEALQNFGVAQNPQQTQEYLDISKNELNRLALLVDKILKMATFEQKGLDLNIESVELNELIRQVVNSMKIQFEKYQAHIHFTPSLQEIVVWVDKTHLTNVVYNLLDNALKYSEDPPQIHIKLWETDTKVHFSIQDEGIGISPEHQPKVFDKFFRVPTGDTHNVKGYGLGLSYVNSVIKQQGGHITLESEVGNGSTFVVNLPKK